MADDKQPVSFGMGDARRIDRTVSHFEHHVLGLPTPAKRRQNGSDPICRGILTSAITAADPDGTTGPTQFTFARWRVDPADTHDPVWLTQDEDDTVGVNRSQMTSDSGKFVTCAWIDGEWNPIEVDC